MQVGSDVEASAGSLDSRNILWMDPGGCLALPACLHACLLACPPDRLPVWFVLLPGISLCLGNILWTQVTAWPVRMSPQEPSACSLVLQISMAFLAIHSLT